MNNNGTALWSQDRTDRLKTLWQQNWSASQIAADLGTTKNAVSGKIDRLRLPGRAKSPPRPKRKRDTRTMHLRLERKPPAPIVEQPIPLLCEPVSLFDAEQHHCRWPMGEPSDLNTFRFCGADKVEGLSYCQHHCRIAYTRRPLVAFA